MSTWTISLDDEGNAASVERGHHPGERAILLVEAPAAAGDATPFIERRECQDCGYIGRALEADSHPKRDEPHLRCHGPVLTVKYVPASELRGAVAALHHVRDALLSNDGGDGVDLEIIEAALGIDPTTPSGGR